MENGSLYEHADSIHLKTHKNQEPSLRIHPYID